MGQRGNGHGNNQRHHDRNDQRSERYDDRRDQRREQPRQTPPREELIGGCSGSDHRPRTRAVAGTPNQEIYHKALKQNDITVCDGPAGSGKTYLSVGEAVHQVLGRQDTPIKKILLIRPIVPADGEDLGFLPGDVFKLEGPSKAGPYMRPVLHAMEKFCYGWDEVRRLFKERIVEVVPLAYLRGATFDDTYMILDEAQNTTEAQMKLFITRLGMNSKIVVSGDRSQCDLDPEISNGLEKAARVFARGNFKNFKSSFCQLTVDDILRSPALAEIITAWDSEGAVEVNGHTNGYPKGLSNGDPKRFAI